MSPLNSPSSIRRASSPFNNQILPADQVRVKIQTSNLGKGYFNSVNLLGRSSGLSPITGNNIPIQSAGIYLFKSDAENKK
jgi:hypothetical protein